MSFLFDVVFHNSRAAQRMANNNAPVRTRVSDIPNAERGGFCGALQRIQPPMPAGLARRLANKENYGLGKVSYIFESIDAIREFFRRCFTFSTSYFSSIYTIFPDFHNIINNMYFVLYNDFCSRELMCGACEQDPSDFINGQTFYTA